MTHNESGESHRSMNSYDGAGGNGNRAHWHGTTEKTLCDIWRFRRETFNLNRYLATTTILPHPIRAGIALGQLSIFPGCLPPRAGASGTCEKQLSPAGTEANEELGCFGAAILNLRAQGKRARPPRHEGVKKHLGPLRTTSALPCGAKLPFRATVSSPSLWMVHKNAGLAKYRNLRSTVAEWR